MKYRVLILVFIAIIFAMGFSVQSDRYKLSADSSTVIFQDDFSTDPNTSGLWRIYRLHPSNSTNEVSWDAGNDLLYLTRAQSELGAAMFADIQLTTQSWEAQFRFKVGGGSGADGFVFMFYKDESAYGEPGCGGSLGFQIAIDPPNNCIPMSEIKGYGIEFDNFYNPSAHNISDPSSNHIALIQDTVGNHLAYVDDPRTEDDIWHDALIRFDNGHVFVLIDGHQALEYVIPNPDYTYTGIGFSAATGSKNNNHLIDNIIVRSIGGEHLELSLPFDYGSLTPVSAFLSRTRSVFDHDLPLGFNGDDGNNVVTSYLGLSLPSSTTSAITSYDQHNGYDFSGRLIEDGNIRAPANGSITFGYDSENLYSCELPSGERFTTRSCMATIYHGNGWHTQFLHLSRIGGTDRNPICHVENTGRSVEQDDVIGQIGNTGCSTSSHIHMEVLRNGVVFDPSGWQGNDTNSDPWEEHPDGTASFEVWDFSVPSLESWEGIDGEVGASIISTNNTSIEIPPGTFSGMWDFSYVDTPVADPSNGLLPTGHSFLFNGQQASQNITGVDIIESSFTVTIPYSNTEVKGLRENTLWLYWWNEDLDTWEPLPTNLNIEANSAVSIVDRFGLFALLGEDSKYYQHLPIILDYAE